MMSEANVPFATMLRDHRVARGLSQEALAEAAGLSREAIGLLERGARRSPRRETVDVLARALKLTAAERAQLLDAAAKGPASASLRPSPLSLRLTSFIGREREIAEVRELLLTKRMLTLSGPGGIGKTSLALAVAEAMHVGFADGAALVDLAPLSDGELVPYTIAAVLGVRERPGEPILTTLGTAMEPTQRLVVLDNCEHLLLSCARVVEALLRASPRLRILATSREPLRIGAEVVWRVPSLTLPDEDDRSLSEFPKSEAVRLFVERAQAIRPDYVPDTSGIEAVEEICRRLDGIPLAIELAAARVAVLTPEQIARHLGDRFRLLTTGSRTASPRHQTLRATLTWSYDLLRPNEQALLRQLAVFVGGWTQAAAEAVMETGRTDGLDVFEGVASLAAKSLVEVADRAGESRFTMLETTRAYARERLDESGQEPVFRSRHAAYYLALCGSLLNVDRMGPLEPERDNLRAALGWFEEAGDIASYSRLIDLMSQVWNKNGPLSEISDWLARLRAMPGFADAAVEVQALELMTEIRLELRRDSVATRAASERLLALGRSSGSLEWEQQALLRLGWTSLELGDLTRAEFELDRRLSLLRDMRKTVDMTNTLILLGDVARLRGEDDRARARYNELVELVRAESARTPQVVEWLPWQERNEGFLDVHRGEFASAESNFRESMAEYRRAANALGIVECLFGFAALAAARGDPRLGTRLLGAASAALSTLGMKLYSGDSFERDRTLQAVQTSLSQKDFAAAWNEGQAMNVEQAIAVALDERG